MRNSVLGETLDRLPSDFQIDRSISSESNGVWKHTDFAGGPGSPVYLFFFLPLSATLIVIVGCNIRVL